MSEQPSYVAFFGVMGATSAMVFSGKCSVINNKSWIFWAEIDLVYEHSLALGAAYGTAKSGTGIAAMSVMRPELIVKSIIPVVMAGILAIYGLVVAVLIGNGSELSWSCDETLLTSLTVLSNRCLLINIFTNKTKWAFCLDKNETFFCLQEWFHFKMSTENSFSLLHEVMTRKCFLHKKNFLHLLQSIF